MILYRQARFSEAVEALEAAIGAHADPVDRARWRIFLAMSQHHVICIGNWPGFCIGICHSAAPSCSANDQAFAADLGPCWDHLGSVRPREPSQELLESRERPPLFLVGVQFEGSPLIPTPW
jgi:hypothetical protein